MQDSLSHPCHSFIFLMKVLPGVPFAPKSFQPVPGQIAPFDAVAAPKLSLPKPYRSTVVGGRRAGSVHTTIQRRRT